jgi:hypothetical protein
MDLYRESTYTIPFLLETTQSKYKRHRCIHMHWLHMRMDRSTIVRTRATYSERHTTSIYHHGSYYYHHHMLLASTITARILLQSPHTTSIYHMEIQPLHGVQQNVSLGSDTPPKRDALPLHPKSRQAKWWCCACVIAGHEWSIACDPFDKKGTPTFLRDKHKRARPAEAKATHTISGHAIHLVEWALATGVAFQRATTELAA